MGSNWDRFDEVDDLPFFTLEERERIDRKYDEMQRRYDPVAAERRRNRTFVFGRRHDEYDAGKKIRDAEVAAGWTRSNPYD